MRPRAIQYATPAPAPGPPVPRQTDDMIVQYIPLIKYIAQRLAMRLPSHILMEDLISSGVVGLMDAIAKFDPNKKVEFKTYAEFRIRGAMLDELRSLDWVPRSVRQKATHVEKSMLHLLKKQGRPAEDEEVASELGLSLDSYYELLKELTGIPLLDREMLDQEELANCLLDDEEKSPFYLSSLKELKKILSEAINELTQKEKLVVSLYYYEELTLKEIGETLGLTESRICQIHTQAILKLRAKLKRHFKEPP